jgi:catechol 2,3-dioxygenase-like lactoylglutathione lyase family enzyme
VILPSRRWLRSVPRVWDGADILDPPAEYDYDPGYYAVFARDPDGLKIEVVRIP